MHAVILGLILVFSNGKYVGFLPLGAAESVEQCQTIGAKELEAARRDPQLQDPAITLYLSCPDASKSIVASSTPGADT
jgi:hypothetical protein